MTMAARRFRARGWAVLVIGLLAGCARNNPEPAAVAPAPPPAAPTVAPHAASGNYNLTTTLKRTQPAPTPQRTARSRRAARPAPEPTPSLQLDYQPLAAPDATAASSTQLAATVSVPGYTEAPRGRPGQAASWWPVPGDSVIVHWQTPRPGGAIDLRGALKGDTLSGEIWYTSLETGSAFQLGSFTAVKRKR
jgi:hypothetical protein